MTSCFFLANTRKKKSNSRASLPPQRERARAREREKKREGKKKPTGNRIEGMNKESSRR